MFVARTDDEIIARIERVKGLDLFGFEWHELVCRLPFSAAKPYLKDEAKESEWVQSPRDHDAVMAEMLEYMPFAWDKANNCRGISAGRSLAHYAAWVWLVGDDLGDLNKYQFYGKDNLALICNYYGWDHAQWDDGVRSNSEV